MQTTNSSPFLTRPSRATVATTADNQSPVTHDFELDDSERDAWDAVEGKLIDWGRNPGQFDEEGFTAPSGTMIQVAIQLANNIGRQNYPAPTRVVPGIDGSIAFERQGKNWFASIHVCSNGIIEYRLFENQRLVSRDILGMVTVDEE